MGRGPPVVWEQPDTAMRPTLCCVLRARKRDHLERSVNFDQEERQQQKLQQSPHLIMERGLRAEVLARAGMMGGLLRGPLQQML